MPQCNSGEGLVLLASTVAIAISKDLSADDVNILANFVSAVGDNLAIIASQKESNIKESNETHEN